MNHYDVDLIYSYSLRIDKFFRRKVANPHDREDLVQEVLFLAIKKRNSLRKLGSLDSWILGIGSNVLKQYYGREKKQQSKDLPDINYEDKSYERVNINALLDDLPDRLLLIYELYYVNRLKVREISDFLNLKEGTVKYQLYDLRQRIKQKLE